MQKVKQVWYAEPTEVSRKNSPTATGLFLELEDGTLLSHDSTDVVKPFNLLPKDYQPLNA